MLRKKFGFKEQPPTRKMLENGENVERLVVQDGSKLGGKVLYLPHSDFQKWSKLLRRHKRRGRFWMMGGLLVLTGLALMSKWGPLPSMQEMGTWGEVLFPIAVFGIMFFSTLAGIQMKGQVGREMEDLTGVPFSKLALSDGARELQDVFVILPEA